MKTLKNYFAMAALCAVIFGCTDDDPAPVQTKDGVISSQSDVDLDAADLKGEITSSITLSNAQEWVLTGPLSVASGAKLTIDAGTTIKAQAGGTNVYIAVEQGAQIFVNGTAAAPVKMTSGAANPASGDWGGLLIMGNAPISGGGTATTEVVDYTYGGTNATDDSGDITYLIVEYTGARINGDKEFNGVTFYGVGSGTTVSNLAVLYGDDDAVEWFGGSVSVSNLLVANAKDDMFDWTQGYVGQNNTNFYGIRQAGFVAVTSDPRGIEADGNLDGNSPQDAGQSNPKIDGITIIHNAAVEMSDMVKIRRGSGAVITNLYVALGAGATAGDLVDLTDGKGVAIDATSITGTANPANGLDITDIKRTTDVDNVPTTSNGTVTITSGTTSVVNTSIFAWTGFSF
ncbi:hypothetical protein EV198_1744 [Roseivirga ehrenbergii]|uniref:Multidrug transporter n=1 Tax=Roseivirga ehrenbergii (strain DSM 102268 / JCM 13514 / KCTC 12282 / NCIMB 14502 / KMM 6017) TaxID=279360 RepID=A0A150XS06_ROSEK|nr:hypothetical protein [Roseivirga ehrenbergii]KYG81548.1 hypothetical protein MB14_13255 [Roseivirga ehrenbergii]TCL10712.1 hypothetical protein EV198_1744 [Roseivirga ehrenbergii]